MLREKVVVLTEEDISRLKPYAGVRFYELITRMEKKITGVRYKILMKEGRCIFLKRNSCSIYEYRPDTSRRHPFLVTEHYILVAKSCPGIDWNKEQKPDPYKELSKSIAKNIEAFLNRAYYNRAGYRTRARV